MSAKISVNNCSSTSGGGWLARYTSNDTSGESGFSVAVSPCTTVTEMAIERGEEEAETSTLSRNLASRRKWSRMYGPRISETSSTVEAKPVTSILSNISGSINRCSNPKRRRNFPTKESTFKLGSGTLNADPSVISGRVALDRESCRRLGFEVRIEDSWHEVGAGDSGVVLMSIDRVVRSVVLHVRWSHDEIWILPERSRKRNLERRDRAKKFETSTKVNPLFRQTIDSIFLF